MLTMIRVERLRHIVMAQHIVPQVPQVRVSMPRKRKAISQVVNQQILKHKTLLLLRRSKRRISCSLKHTSK